MPDIEVTEDSIRSALLDQEKANVDPAADEVTTAVVADAQKDKPEVKPEPKPETKDAPKEPAKTVNTDTLKKDSGPEEKPKSKWAANEERKGKTWQEINAEKEAIKAERAALAREREEISKAKSAGEVYRDKHGLSAKEYKDAAKEYRAKGEEALAEAAERVADNLVEEERRYRTERTQDDLRKKWSESFNKISAEKPELKDPDSDLHKETLALLKRVPPLAQLPDGLDMAVTLAESLVKGRNYEATTSELKELKSKYEALEKKLSIGSGPPTSVPSEEKAFEDLSLAEMEKRLGQVVSKHDRAAGF